jgi:hypothetical protein
MAEVRIRIALCIGEDENTWVSSYPVTAMQGVRGAQQAAGVALVGFVDYLEKDKEAVGVALALNSRHA